MHKRIHRSVKESSLFARVFDVSAINYFMLFANLITGVVTARYLGPSQKGVYYAVNSWVSMIGYISALGITQAFIWYYNGQGNKRRIFRRTLWIGMTTITSGALVGSALIWFPLHRLGHVAVLWATIGLVLLPVGALYDLCTSYLMVRGRTRAYNTLRVFQGGSSTISVVILATVNHLDLNSYLVSLYLTSLTGTVSCWVVTFKEFRHEPNTESSYTPAVRDFMKKSLAFFVPSLSSMFNARLDQMICTLWLTQKQIGLYGVSSSSLGVLGSVIGAFSLVFYASMAQSDKHLVILRTNKAFRIYVILTFIMLMGVVVASPLVLRFFYGRQYSGAYPTILGLAPVALFSGLIGILYQGYFSLGKPQYATVTEIVGAVSGAALIWVLAPRYGAVGVATANSMSYALDFSMCMFFWTRLGANLHDVVPHWRDVRDLWIASKGRLRTLLGPSYSVQEGGH